MSTNFSQLFSHAVKNAKIRRKFTCRGFFAFLDIRRLAVIERFAAYAAKSSASYENARCMAE